MSKNVIISGIKTTKHEHVGGVVAYSVDGLTEKELNTLYLALCDVHNKVDCRSWLIHNIPALMDT